MKIYVAMIDDRHTDPQAYVFSTPERAIAFAKRKAQESALHPDGIRETSIDGWLYFARYSVEGDEVWVVERELDKEAL